jgi:hypothetical protein
VHAFASAARLLIDLYRDRVVAAAAVPSSSYFPCLTIAQIPPNCMAAAAVPGLLRGFVRWMKAIIK